eukprot:5579038-Prorocentrum_lima.AAC.1
MRTSCCVGGTKDAVPAAPVRHSPALSAASFALRSALFVSLSSKARLICSIATFGIGGGPRAVEEAPTYCAALVL